MLKSVICAALLATGGAAAANAQFPGDAFFVEPSVSVPEDGEGELVMALFAGGEAFGAASLALEWDPDRLEIVAAEPVLADSSAVTLAPGRLQMATANAVALDGPSATVELLKLTVRPLAGAGSVIAINAGLEEALTAAGDRFTSGNAFGAEIVVDAPAPASTASVAAQRTGAARQTVVADPKLSRRIARLRPDGVAVVLQLQGSDGRSRPTLVAPAAAEE